jgi:PAS domain S-box-containing protein
MRFRTMFETLTQGIILRRRDGRVVDANSAAARMSGVTRDQLIGAMVRDGVLNSVDEMGRPLRLADMPCEIALQTGKVVRGRVIGLTHARSNERRWVLIDAVPQTRPGEGEPFQVCSLLSDITEQKKAEIAVAASRAHLALAQRVASLGSAELDFRTGVWQWSDETFRLLGLDKETVQPSMDAMLSVVHEDDRPTCVAALEHARNGVKPLPAEYRIVRSDGSIRTIYREADLVRDEANALVGLIVTNRDVTELRLAERQKEELQAQLLHVQRIDALGVLAGGIAHDLNNTLVPILGLTDLLRNGLSAEKAELLDVIQHAGEKARDLVRQILAFSRGDTPDRAPVDVGAFLQGIRQLVRASVPSTIAIEWHLAKVPVILADTSQLHQVVVNLVANAAQAIGTRLGTIEIALSAVDVVLKPGDAPESCIRLSVSDTGSGMDEATQKRIFEPFFTTKPIGEGTGLGLSVVHGIVTGHGGRIDVDSKIGKGTRFDILLPALSDTEASALGKGPST